MKQSTVIKQSTVGDADKEISTLIATLQDTGDRLEQLTAGEVDSVSDSKGRTFLLQSAQEWLRRIEAAKQAAVLNALPEAIALLDIHGVITAVNETWQHFGSANAVQGNGPGYGVGTNYLAVCDQAHGANAVEARPAADGIRSVLAGTVPHFSLEYPCHAPNEQRWFLMKVSPLAQDSANGVVVMHIDITVRKLAEIAIHRLNRVYAMLSQINTLIVRVRNRDDLFKEACGIAVDDGGFTLAWIGIVDSALMQIVPVASAGTVEMLTEAEAQRMVKDDAPGGYGPAACAWRECRAIVVNDIEHDPSIDFKYSYLDRGVRSLAALPLVVGDATVGVLGLYAPEVGFFDEAEMKLLKELAGDIAFAIDNLDKQDRVDYLAYYDVLTGLANRRLFIERVGPYIKSAADAEHSLALLLVDLERFNNFNDSLGRPAGDALLRHVAERLTHSTGDAGLLARIGADQFAVVLPEIRQEGEVARQLEKLMADLLDHPLHLEDSIFRVPVKAGVALFPLDGDSAEALLRDAGVALKKAKARGDRYLFYAQKMNETVASKLTMENQLRQAIDREEFVLHYQPKVSLASGMLTGAEALIRWNDPRTGLVPPGHFIPVLEETGLIHEVGRWALNKSIEDFLRWRAAGLPAVRVAVNVSTQQLRSPGFVAEIEQAIAVHPDATAGLEIEITESMLMADIMDSINTLEAIRAMGVTIAIDDFGTGYSSLSYLAKLPVDALKIDRSFIVAMTLSSKGLALVSTVITLAHALALKVIAEGVETEEQSRLLRLLACDDMQGFLFSKPVPAETFESLFLAPTVSATA